MKAGFRCFRMDASAGGPITGQVFETNDPHRICKQIEEYEPFMV